LLYGRSVGLGVSACINALKAGVEAKVTNHLEVNRSRMKHADLSMNNL
jgi:hypothetical protein